MIQGGYDTHSGQIFTHARLLEELSGALGAFLDDLTTARLAERVAVLCFSEFGRRVSGQWVVRHRPWHGRPGPPGGSRRPPRTGGTDAKPDRPRGGGPESRHRFPAGLRGGARGLAEIAGGARPGPGVRAAAAVPRLSGADDGRVAVESDHRAGVAFFGPPRRLLGLAGAALLVLASAQGLAPDPNVVTGLRVTPGYLGLCLAELYALLVVVTITAGAAIASERQERTWEALALSSLSDTELVLGKAAGVLLPVMLLALLLVPVHLAYGMAWGTPRGIILSVQVLFLGAGWARPV